MQRVAEPPASLGRPLKWASSNLPKKGKIYAISTKRAARGSLAKYDSQLMLVPRYAAISIIAVAES